MFTIVRNKNSSILYRRKCAQDETGEFCGEISYDKYADCWSLVYSNVIDKRFKTETRYYSTRSSLLGGGRWKKRDSHSIVWALHVHRFSIGIQHLYIFIYIPI